MDRGLATPRTSRREVLEHAAGLLASLSLAACRGGGRRRPPGPSIERAILWNGRQRGSSWFHPRPCLLEAGSVLMTMQAISGSDVFGPVHWTRSDDGGRTWRVPDKIPALRRRDVGGGMLEGVCDVVPQFHPPTDTVLAMGHNVYYRAGRLTQPYANRFPVYVVGDGAGGWSERRKLEWDHPLTSGIYTCGCGERLVLDDGEILIPISFGPVGRRDRAVTTLRCAFDGETLRVRESGNELRLAVGRGLLEPSLARWAGSFRMTIRAEDGHGYWSRSPDGLQWSRPQPWSFEDGQALVMSTTQQHWLTGPDALWLVYTRRTEANARVMRWRAPLFMARVDPGSMTLDRSSEEIVLPLRGDPVRAPGQVARMGNFHTLSRNGGEAWVTVGESRPRAGYRGDLLLARIHW